ncbi:unnamed protein product [Closterium sp. NIES-65]|nr:unnamed protein product [Closterium sp. NIES-65]
MPEIYNDLCLPWRFLPQLEQEASRIEEEQQQHDKEEAELDIEEEEDTPDSTLPDSLSLLHEDRANTESYSPHSLQEHVLLKFLFLRDLLPPVQLEQEASRIKEQQQHDKEEAELDIEEEDGPDDDALPDALSGADVAADVDKAGDDLLDSSANVAAAQAAAAKAAAEKESRGRRENQQQGERQREVPAGAGLTAEAPGRDPLEHGTEKRLYIVMISIHGLVRGENMELGRDSDTGGQVKYVVEIARALASMPQVYRVDLLTRQIVAPGVDWSYGEPSEMLSSLRYDPDGLIAGESVGAYIIRLPCGPRDQYLRKEALWPYVDEFVDGALTHIMHMSRELADQIGDGQRVWPYMIHGHYADAGDIAALLSGALNVPMVLTGHSLGRNKLEQLLKQGRMSRAEINTQYAIDRRIEAEEFSLDAAELVVTSTRQEVEEQWGLYDGFDVRLERVLRARQLRGVSCHGRFMPRMAVIPPGMDFSNVVVPDIDGSDSPGPEPPIWAEVRKFWSNPHKPIILALARPDPKKNLTTLVRAFGESQALRDLANLCLVMGNRDDIDAMSAGNAEVLTTVLKLIDKYDLYGQVAYPKHHKQAEVPDIYALAAKSKGVFVNPALVEPFGLTLIEMVFSPCRPSRFHGAISVPSPSLFHPPTPLPSPTRPPLAIPTPAFHPLLLISCLSPFAIFALFHTSQAAAHGLPMVATKNGGPVDIQKMLSNGPVVYPLRVVFEAPQKSPHCSAGLHDPSCSNGPVMLSYGLVVDPHDANALMLSNGLVVDPHDASALSSALLQLVADRALWTDCRKSALANIHKYSWPQARQVSYSGVAAAGGGQSLWTDCHKSALANIQKYSWPQVGGSGCVVVFAGGLWRAAALFDQVAASATRAIHISSSPSPLAPYFQQHCASLLTRVAQSRLRHPVWRAAALFDQVAAAASSHCASLLTRVAQSRLRHPVWRAAALFDQVAAATSSTHPSTGLHSESLRDIQDLSLRLSFDGKFWGGGSFQGGSMDLSFMLDNLGVIRPDGRSASGYAAEPSHAAAGGGFGGSGGLGGGEGLGEGAALGIHNRLGNYSFTGGMGSESVGRYREGVGGSGRLQGMQEEGEDGGAGGAGAGEKGSAAGAAAAAAFEGLRLRRRRRLIVVAVDEYDPVGRPGSSVLDSLCAALEVAYRHNTGTLRERVVWGMGPGGEIGVVLATALTARETVAMLTAAGVGLRQLDALIAGGGSEVYYSVPCSTASELGAAAAGGTGAGAGAGAAAGMAAGLVSAMAPLEDREGWQLLPDPDYFAHIEYRWSADGVRRSMGRILAHAIKGTASGGAASAATTPVAGSGGVFPPPAAALSAAAAAAAGNGAAAAAGNGAATNEEEYVRSISFSDGLTAIASEPAAPSTHSGIPGSKSVTGSRLGGAGAGSRGVRGAVGSGLLLQQQQLLAVQRVCVEDEMRTTSRRLAYRVLDIAQMPTAADLRRRLRLRGLRCHVGYCRAATCLHILPLHASRSQALRYLCVRWGLEPADLAVVVGSPAGADGDYAQLLSGMHHTLILEPPPADVAQHQGAAAAAGMDPFAEYRRKLLHEFVPRSDVHLPNLVNVEDSSEDKVSALAGALEKIGFA